MKESRRTKRMQMHHERRKDRNAALNMVSLMDIFTILVFFLLVSTTDSEVLPSPKNINLPESVAQKPPKENVIIMVSQKDIMVQGKKISSVDAALQSKQSIITPLLVDLKIRADEGKGKRKTDPKRGVTIMGDKEIPYQLLKKIMLTCANADYTNISLAVAQKPAPEEQS